jgi:hypothetical protein
MFLRGSVMFWLGGCNTQASSCKVLYAVLVRLTGWLVRMEWNLYNDQSSYSVRIQVVGLLCWTYIPRKPAT